MKTIGLKAKLIIISSFITLAVIASVIVVSNQKKGYRTVVVVEVSGKVSVVRDGIEYEAYSGMHLSEGHVIVTSSNSYVRMVLDDDKYIKLEEGSRIKFEKLGALGSGKTAINLERGVITNEIVNPLSEDEEFVVNTPNAVLAVRGTFFRVELGTNEKGEVLTDVYTYSGKIASRRILPNGKIVDENVIIEAGYKTLVNMSDKTTRYVIEKSNKDEDSSEKEKTFTEPIELEDISDEDLVDIYFASENGHKMFIEGEKLENIIEERDIELDDYTPIYESAKNVVYSNNMIASNVIPSPDDSEPLKRKDDVIYKNNSGKESGDTSNNTTIGAPSDGVHTHTRVTKTIQPTCVKSGVKLVTCEECNEVLEEEQLPYKGHKEKEEVIEPTCTKEGSRTLTCKECNEIISNDIMKAKGHTEKIELKEATCTKRGSRLVECTECELVLKYEELEEKGHIKKTETEEATCTKDGNTETKCIDCGEILDSAKLEASGHKETVEVVEATCTKKGKEVVSCTECNEVIKTKEIESKGHKEKTITLEATCILSGSKETLCTECGEVLDSEEIEAKGHKEKTNTTEATCTESGSKETLCTECGEVLDSEKIEAKGHKEKTNTTEATCTASGSKETSCTECGEVLDSETIDAKGHKEKTNTIEATCTSQGSKEISCTECGEILDKQIIEKKDHVEQKVGTEELHSQCGECGVKISGTHDYTKTVIEEKTCTINGLIKYSCGCDYEYTEQVEAGHDIEMVAEEMVHARCKECDYIEDVSFHNMTEEIIEEATCTEKGKKYKSCECGYGYDTEIEEKGHTEVYGATEDVHKKCSTCDETLVSTHNYTSIVTEDTCEKGERKYVCDGGDDGEDGCGYSYTATESPPGHTLIDSTLASKECSVCNSIFYDVSDSSTYFTDTAYRGYIQTTLDINGDNYLSKAECDAVTTIDVSNYNEISSISTWMFKNLNTLNVDNTKVTLVDTNSNTQLKSLSCLNTTNLSLVNVEQCSLLEEVYCSNTSLQSLNLSGHTNLTKLTCKSNTSLMSLELRGLTKLTSLTCQNNTQMTELDLSGCTSFNTNNLSISGNTNLSWLNLSNCTALTSIDKFKELPLQTLMISNCSKLTNLSWTGSKLQKIEGLESSGVTFVSLSNTMITEFKLDGSQSINTVRIMVNSKLTEVNINECNNLKELYIDNNDDLASVTINECDSLTNNLSICVCNEVSKISITNCNNLTTANLENLSSLTDIDLSGSNAITSLNIVNPSASYNIVCEVAGDTFEVSSIPGLTETDVSNISELFGATFDSGTKTFTREGAGTQVSFSCTRNGTTFRYTIN